MKKWIFIILLLLTSVQSYAIDNPIPAPFDIDASDNRLDKVIIGNYSIVGAGTFTIARATSLNGAKNVIATAWPLYHYDDINAIPGVKYYYFVSAFYPALGLPSDWSEPDIGYRGLQTPVNISATDGTDLYAVVVSYNPVIGADYYEIHRALTETGTKTKLGNSSSNSYRDITAEIGTTYHYFVKACSWDEVCSLFSYPNTGFKADTKPQLSASDGTYVDKVVISDYHPFPGAEFYLIYRASSSTGDKILLAQAVTSLTYDDTTVTEGTTYYYFVKSCNEFLGCSDYSEYNTGYAQALPSLPAPTNIEATDGEYSDKVTITNYAVTGAERYYFYYAETAYGVKNEIASTTLADEFSTNIGNMGTEYYFFVKAYNSAQGFSDYSAYNTGYRSFIPPPTAISASDGTFTDKVVVSNYATAEGVVYRIYRSGPANPYKSRIAITTDTIFEDTSINLTQPGRIYYYFVQACSGGAELECSVHSPYDIGFIGLDTSPPTGHSVSFNNSIITGANYINGTGFTISSAEVGTIYTYTIKSSRGTDYIGGSGYIIDSEQNISPPELNTLLDGTLTLSVWLEDSLGNRSDVVNNTAILDVRKEEISIRMFDNTTSESVKDDDIATFIVSLTSKPASEVTISFDINDTTEGHISEPSESYDIDAYTYGTKTFRVRGVDDEERDGDINYSIEITATSLDPYYNDKSIQVELVNKDDEIVINPAIIMYLLN